MPKTGAILFFDKANARCHFEPTWDPILFMPWVFPICTNVEAVGTGPQEARNMSRSLFYRQRTVTNSASAFLNCTI